MNRTVEVGKTLLVDGPASVRLVSGKAEALGFAVKHASRIVVRDGKRLPFFIAEIANFDISIGENGSVEEVEGNTIPTSWAESVEVLIDIQKKPAVAMVMGKADSGKTSYCTYLINKLASAKRKIAILNGDLGQSDIGPPCTVAYAFVDKPLTELYELKAQNAFFVGATSPSVAVSKTIEGMVQMKGEILGAEADFMVVNTDGWVEDEDAVEYKLQLADALEPDMAVCFQQENELKPLIAALEKRRTMEVKSSLAVKPRSMEKRRSLRERSYAKYLKDAKMKTFHLNEVTIERSSVSKGEERGLLLGLYGVHRKFLGIGVLREVDPVRKKLKIFTSVSAKPASVVIGKVRLEENHREVEAL